MSVRPDPRLAAQAGALCARLQAEEAPDGACYDAIVAHLAAGVAAYRSAGFALVHYPGLPGSRGLRSEGVEGFARTAPLLAAWMRHRGALIPLPGEGAFDAAAHLARGLAAGADPEHPEFWGWPRDFDQRIIEAADIALTLWLLREAQGDAPLPGRALSRLLDWLAAHLRRASYGGNWHLCQIVVGAVLERFGRPPDPEGPARAAAIAGMRLRDGWFAEGHAGVPDLYSAWQIHHLLALLRRVAPDGPLAFAEADLRAFAPGFAHLFAPEGFPLWGRSLCYRFAVAAPLVHAAALDPPAIPPGLARRAMDVTWACFAAEGGLAAGGFSQGPLGAPRPELLENYCGRASCLWSLRSLVAAYLLPPEHRFWRGPPEPLPVERGDFRLRLDGPGFTVTGEGGRVSLAFDRNADAPEAPPLAPHGPWRRLAESLLRRPLRPDNYARKYGARQYRSDNPLWR